MKPYGYIDNHPKQPYYVKFVDKIYPTFIYGKLSAVTIFNRVWVKREVKPFDLEPILRHEEQHIRQWFNEGWWFVLKYFFSRKCRLQYEAEGFAVQIQAYGVTDTKFFFDQFAQILHDSYFLFYPMDKIKEVLCEELGKIM